MNVMDAIRQRRSIRRYQDQPVPEKLLNEILEAARQAPSARNLQAWRFIAATSPSVRQQLAEATGQDFVATAPVIIAGAALDTERVMSCGIPAHPVDLAIAMTNISLAAVELGLGTCWIGAFDQAAAKEALGIPEPYVIVQLMTLGFPAESPDARPRKPLEEISSRDHF